MAASSIPNLLIVPGTASQVRLDHGRLLIEKGVQDAQGIFYDISIGMDGANLDPARVMPAIIKEIQGIACGSFNALMASLRRTQGSAPVTFQQLGFVCEPVSASQTTLEPYAIVTQAGDTAIQKILEHQLSRHPVSLNQIRWNDPDVQNIKQWCHSISDPFTIQDGLKLLYHEFTKPGMLIESTSRSATSEKREEAPTILSTAARPASDSVSKRGGDCVSPSKSLSTGSDKSDTSYRTALEYPSPKPLSADSSCSSCVTERPSSTFNQPSSVSANKKSEIVSTRSPSQDSEYVTASEGSDDEESSRGQSPELRRPIPLRSQSYLALEDDKVDEPRNSTPIAISSPRAVEIPCEKPVYNSTRSRSGPLDLVPFDPVEHLMNGIDLWPDELIKLLDRSFQEWKKEQSNSSYLATIESVRQLLGLEKIDDEFRIRIFFENFETVRQLLNLEKTDKELRIRMFFENLEPKTPLGTLFDRWRQQARKFYELFCNDHWYQDSIKFHDSASNPQEFYQKFIYHQLFKKILEFIELRRSRSTLS